MRSPEIIAFNSKGQQACLCVFLPVQEICGDLHLTRNVVYQNISSGKRNKKGFPWESSGLDSFGPTQGMQVPSLVREQ